MRAKRYSRGRFQTVGFLAAFELMNSPACLAQTLTRIFLNPHKILTTILICVDRGAPRFLPLDLAPDAGRLHARRGRNCYITVGVLRTAIHRCEKSPVISTEIVLRLHFFLDNVSGILVFLRRLASGKRSASVLVTPTRS
jgi:hypothetical protein